MSRLCSALLSTKISDRSHLVLLICIWVSANFPDCSAFAQKAQAGQQDAFIEGSLRNAAGEAVSGAFVVLQRREPPATFESRTNAAGTFVFSGLVAGVYSLKAEKSKWGQAIAESLSVSAGEKKRISLVLSAEGGAAEFGKSSSAKAASSSLQFADEPNFTVAGVTDRNNVGLHASATDVRTSEALAKDTRALESDASPEGLAGTSVGPTSGDNARIIEKQLQAALAAAPNDFEANQRLGEFYCRFKRYSEAIPLLTTAFQIDSRNFKNGYDLVFAYLGNNDLEKAREQNKKLTSVANSSEAHRLTGDLDERLGDSLEAVREYQEATRLEPSEQNYFDWGTELLVHRATQPAVDVFTNGFKAHVDSARMLMGLGAALYASGSYSEAAKRLCEAVDLKPADPAPYLFLGKIAKASPEILACAEEKLARFVSTQSGNAMANYYYGLILWKNAKASHEPSALDQARLFLEKAVELDPKLAEGFLQLGILQGDRGDFARAVPQYQKAIELNPHLAEAHYRLAQALRRTGSESKAEEEMQTYKEIQKEESAAREREEHELPPFLIIMKRQSLDAVPH